MNREMKETYTVGTATPWVSGLNVAAGIWLIIAPFVLLYGSGTAKINNIVLGVVIGIFALIRVFFPSFRTIWLSWLNALWGIWLIIGSFMLGYAGPARNNDIIVGIIVLVLGLCSVAVSEQDQPIPIH
jgi:hypothetical protein